MTPFIQALAIQSGARLSQADVFLAAGATFQQELTPAENDVWIIYQIEMLPAGDPNLQVSLTGPNVTAGLTLRSLTTGVSEGAYVATPSSPLILNWLNGMSSAAYVVARYITLSADRYRTLVDPAYTGEPAGWLRTLGSIGHQVT